MIGTSRVHHLAGLTNSLYTNVKTIKLSKTAVTLKATKTFALKPTVTKEDSRKALPPSGHGPQYRYATSDSTVAMVDGNGRITAKAPGTCDVYVFAQNGRSAQITVTVK